MFNSAKKNPSEWFPCLNVGDDHEEKADRRDDADLVIPGNSLVEIVGVRTINDDHFVHEIRLAIGEVPEGSDDTEEFVPISTNYAFTGPGDLLKDHMGRITFTPAMVRFEGDALDDANAKIAGRYKAPERTGKYTDAEYDEFERLEKLFGQGVQQQLLGDPKGHLKLPKDVSKISQYGIQSKYLGWNCSGIYKFHTGEKTKGKKDDADKEKNLLAFLSPAVQMQPKPPIRYITKVPYSTYATKSRDTSAYGVGGAIIERVYAIMIDGETPIPVSVMHKEPDGNYKLMVTFSGDSLSGTLFFELDGHSTVDINPLAGSLTAASLTTALEALPSIGKGNVKVSIWPGRWLLEFVGQLAGKTVNQIDVYYPDHNSQFNVLILETVWADSGIEEQVLYPYPLAGEFISGVNPTNHELINDAVAPGSFGLAVWLEGMGYVSGNNECREYAGDGTPDLEA